MAAACRKPNFAVKQPTYSLREEAADPAATRRSISLDQLATTATVSPASKLLAALSVVDSIVLVSF